MECEARQQNRVCEWDNIQGVFCDVPSLRKNKMVVVACIDTLGWYTCMRKTAHTVRNGESLFSVRKRYSDMVSVFLSRFCTGPFQPWPFLDKMLNFTVPLFTIRLLTICRYQAFSLSGTWYLQIVKVTWQTAWRCTPILLAVSSCYRETSADEQPCSVLQSLRLQ